MALLGIGGAAAKVARPASSAYDTAILRNGTWKHPRYDHLVVGDLVFKKDGVWVVISETELVPVGQDHYRDEMALRNGQ